jgi:hypothetical protein
MAVEVGSSPHWWSASRCEVGVSGGDLGVAHIHAGIQDRGDERISENVRVHAGDRHAGGGQEAMQPAHRGVPVHAAAAPVQQDRPGDAVAGSGVARARDEHVLDDLAVPEQSPLCAALSG